jgi:hypothetical protein
MKLAIATVLFLLASSVAAGQQVCPSPLQKDWKKAVWRVPLHIALSLPVTAATVVIPPVGKKFVRWRTKAETKDVAQHLDTCMKATIDLYSQTALVRAMLKMYGITVP